jgi:adenylate kinase
MENTKNYLIFFGPPGSGKGTQADMLGLKLKLPVISVGELLRREQVNTKLGHEIKALMDKGKMVPNKIAEAMVEKFLKKSETKNGVIFDGYPREKAQQDFLIKLIGEKNIRAILIKVSDAEVKKRLSGRRVCACGASYHLKFNPPKKKEICDLCGKKLLIRGDDTPATINKRLKLFRQDTVPIIDYWRQRGKLIQVDGERGIEEIQRDILKKL